MDNTNDETEKIPDNKTWYSFAPIIDPTGFGLRYCVITMINLIGNAGEGGISRHQQSRTVKI